MKKIHTLVTLSLIFMFSMLCFHVNATQTEITSDADFTYSINFMWINKTLDETHEYILPKEKKEIENIFENIHDWREKNPTARIQFWYDSKNIAAHSLKKTEALINPETHLVFRDIRTLDCVKANEEVFSKEIPIYFQADLSRAIYLYEIMLKKETTFAVHADLDMKACDKKTLFDDETLHHLVKTGLVMAKGGKLGFENGFQMASHKNVHMLKAMKFALIDVNIERAKIALDQGYFISYNHIGMYSGKVPGNPMQPLQQIVYYGYPNMFTYFYGLDNDLDFEIRDYKFNVNEIPLEAFNVRTNSMRFLTLDNTRNPSIDLKPFQERYSITCEVTVPKKSVSLPPASLNYDD